MLYRISVTAVYLVSKLLFNISFEGLENIPTDRGFILASNHRSNFDPLFAVIKLPLKVKMYFMAKAELFEKKFPAWFLRNVNAFPIDRGKGDDETLDKAVDMLQSGKPLLMFLEGTRSKTIKPGRPRSGAALISARAGVGILPTSIDFGKKLDFRSKVVVRYHPMIEQKDLAIDLENPRTTRNASKKIMEVIISGLTHLSDEEELA